MVLHFAMAPLGSRSGRPQIYLAQAQFDVNVKGTYNVVETAAQCGVKRLIYTSSMTVSMHSERMEETGRPMTEEDPVTPTHPYRLTKYLAEQICRCHADRFPLGVICFRLGNFVPKPGRPMTEMKFYPGWIHRQDVGRAYRLAVQAKHTGFEVFHILADVPGLKWDVSKARRLLGFIAEHRFEEYWPR